MPQRPGGQGPAAASMPSEGSGDQDVRPFTSHAKVGIFLWPAHRELAEAEAAKTEGAFLTIKGGVPSLGGRLFHPGVCLRASSLASFGQDTPGVAASPLRSGCHGRRPGIRRFQHRIGCGGHSFRLPAHRLLPLPQAPVHAGHHRDVQAQSGSGGPGLSSVGSNPQPTVIWYAVGAGPGWGGGLPAGESVCGYFLLAWAWRHRRSGLGPWRWGPPGCTDGRPCSRLQDGPS